MTYETFIVNLNDLEAFVQDVIDDGNSIHFIFCSTLGGNAYVTVATPAP